MHSRAFLAHWWRNHAFRFDRCRLGLVLLAPPAFSQTYPTKPIHIVAPYAPGGIATLPPASSAPID